MAEWKKPLPADAKVGDDGHPENHNQLKAAISEVRTNVDAVEDKAAWGNLPGKPSEFKPAAHKHVKADITDFPSIPAAPTADTLSGATEVGKKVLKAADAKAARDAIGAGTSSLALGTTATTALKGDTAIPTIPSVIGAGELEAGTATTQRTISAKILHDFVAKMIADAAAPPAEG